MFQRYVEHNLTVYQRILARIRGIPAFTGSDEALGDAFLQCGERVKRGEPALDLLPESFALAMEAARRALHLTMYPSQILTAIAMSYGRIAELPTGEGKTLAAVLTAAHASLAGKGVHVLTFNDYLAQRDAEWMGPVYRLLKRDVAFIRESSDADARRDAYAADITYITAKEAGFDFLRSFLHYDPSERVQRPFHTAIVDEADSIMIDEARIPLVLAGDDTYHISFDERLFEAVRSLRPTEDFSVDEYGNSISLTEEGISRMESALAIGNLYDATHAGTIARIQLVLQAEYLVRRDVDYLVRDGKVLLVDEFTGRTVLNREWPDGLQAAVLQKEGLAPREYGTVMNRIPLRDFLGFYPQLCGMTGTAAPAAADFFTFYDKIVTVIPPNRPCIRRDHPDKVYATKEQKIDAVADQIQRLHKTGQPVLVGTMSVEDSTLLAGRLLTSIPDLAVLNAANDQDEARVIAQAGRQGAVTISTNMAGRGVDIRLGGDDPREADRVRQLGGLYVIGTGRQESRRIDNQLRGRSGRQGDPGETCFFVSLTDELMVRYHLAESLPTQILTTSTDGLIEYPSVNRAIAHTQRIAEGQNVDAKITLAKYSRIIESQRVIIAAKRDEILNGERRIDVLRKTKPEMYEHLVAAVGAEAFAEAQRKIELFAVNRCWSDHLVTADDALDEVRVIARLGRDPASDFAQKMDQAFGQLEESICETILRIFSEIRVADGKLALEEAQIRGPASTRTYMVNDGTEWQNQINSFAVSMNPVSAQLYVIYLLVDFLKKRHKKKKGFTEDG